MCDPITIAMAAFQAVKGVSEQNAAVERANQQNAYYLQNAANAREASLNENRALNRRQDQEAMASAQKNFETMIQGQKNAARIQTAAGESGIQGLGVQRILDSYDRETSVAQGAIDRNFDYVRQQIGDEKEGTKFTFQNRVNSVQKGYAPSAAQAGLGIAMNVGGTLAADPGFRSSANSKLGNIFGTGAKKPTSPGLWDNIG